MRLTLGASVFCSSISATSMAYGSDVLRQGNCRPSRLYHSVTAHWKHDVQMGVVGRVKLHEVTGTGHCTGTLVWGRNRGIRAGVGLARFGGAAFSSTASWQVVRPVTVSILELTGVGVKRRKSVGGLPLTAAVFASQF